MDLGVLDKDVGQKLDNLIIGLTCVWELQVKTFNTGNNSWVQGLYLLTYYL